jgi:hypothetical protein
MMRENSVVTVLFFPSVRQGFTYLYSSLSKHDRNLDHHRSLPQLKVVAAAIVAHRAYSADAVTVSPSRQRGWRE